MKKPKLLITNHQLLPSGGYIALFSFLVMTTVLGTLLAVFTNLVLRNMFIARANGIDLINTYAAEGFAEDAIGRLSGGWPPVADGETLTVGDSSVSSAVATAGAVTSYAFSASLGGKYFKDEILKLDTGGPSVTIKEWKDSP